MKIRKNGPRTITLELPIITISRANSREGRHARADRVKGERKTTALGFSDRTIAREDRYHVHLVRVAPSALDPVDNLPMSMKAVRDEVAKLLGFDDGPKAPIRWTCSQERGGVREYAVGVTITALGPDERPWCPTCSQALPAEVLP